MNDISTTLQTLARQEQFLDVVDRDEAVRRFHNHLNLRPVGLETVPLSQAVGRTLARSVVAAGDGSGFYRASVDWVAGCGDGTVRARGAAPPTPTLQFRIINPG